MDKKTIKFILKFFIFIGFGYLFYVLTVINVFQDISLEPILDKPYTSLKNSQHKDSVYLISYADGPEIFYQNQNFLVYSALNKGVDHFINYRRNLLDRDFLEKYGQILNEKCGAGYWLWKPWIILKTMKSTPANATIIYLDAGFCLCGELDEIFNLSKFHDVMIAEGGPADGSMSSIVKEKILEKFEIPLTIAKQTKQILANFIVIKNTPAAREFIEKWFKLCCEKDLITGNNYGPGDHLHDQALLNITYLKYPEGVKILRHDQSTKFLSWHHRKNDRKTITLTAYLRKHLTIFERKLLNAPVLKDIRYFLRTKFLNLLEKHPQATEGL